jgi:hypothetical protein
VFYVVNDANDSHLLQIFAFLSEVMQQRLWHMGLKPNCNFHPVSQGEIENVITVVAKTNHYWTEHQQATRL